jgi:hypothetical protein
LIDENNLWSYADSGVLSNNLQYLTVLNGSSIGFKYFNVGTTYGYTLISSMYDNGTLATGRTTINIFGKGLAIITTASNFAINMNASGNFYFGKRFGATITDQISTPPVTLSATSGVLNIRGDTAPTVLWNCNLTKI